MSEENQILKKVDDYVFKLFKTANTDQLLYHNYKHTYDVVEACKEIGEGLDLGSDELEILGSHGMQAHKYPEMLKMIIDGKLHPEKLIEKTIFFT